MLRRYRLDELPQLVNMLRGDMNLVGPRPHPVSNQELFRQGNCRSAASMIPYYAVRSVVRPGMTGWAQIRYGYANNLEEETEKMRYDLYYIKHLSFWRDLRILIDTVKTVLGERESSPPRRRERPPGPCPAAACRSSRGPDEAGVAPTSWSARRAERPRPPRGREEGSSQVLEGALRCMDAPATTRSCPACRGSSAAGICVSFGGSGTGSARSRSTP